MFTYGPLFKQIWDLSYPKQTVDGIILQGGTDSGKTVAAVQKEITIARCTKPPKTNPFDIVDPLITCLNESVPNAKKGAYRTFQSLVNDNQYCLDGIKDWNRTDRIVEFKTGWIMAFEGATDEQAAKQGKRQRLFVNEANGISWPVFWQYAKRTRQQWTVDYNPSAPFWAHDKLIDTLPKDNDLNAVVKRIISDHRHNPFLSPREHEKTEQIRDKELWLVYARGCTGNLIGTVYPDWLMIPTADFPWDSDKLFYGLDVGWTNDPTALVLVAKQGEKIFLHELMYEPGVAPSLLKDIIVAKGKGRVFCEHAPDMIKQLRRLGLDVSAARKGPGSIQAGISKVKEYKVFYTDSSTNIREELKRYTWAIDDETKRPTNEPVDAFNHLMDAIRYAIYTNFYKQQ